MVGQTQPVKVPQVKGDHLESEFCSSRSANGELEAHQRMMMAYETDGRQGLCICSGRLGARKLREATLLEQLTIKCCLLVGEEGRRDSRAEKYLRRRVRPSPVSLSIFRRLPQLCSVYVGIW